MDAREILLTAIDCALAAQIISQEDLLKVCGKNGCFVRSYTQNKLFKEEVVDYLNSIEAVSLNNFTNVMRYRGIKIKFSRTLERCLARGKFAYKQKVNGRPYYVKGNKKELITEEDIVL